MSKILLDLDGVLANTPNHLLKCIYKEYGLGEGLTIQGQNVYNIEEYVPGFSFEMLERLFMVPSFWEGIPAFEKVSEFTEHIRKLGEVHIVTDRRWYPELEEETRQWLVNNDVHFDVLSVVKGSEKCNYAEEYGIDVAVEDRVKNIEHLCTVCPTIMLEWPYNRDKITSDIFLGKNFFLARNYSEAICAIEEVLNKSVDLHGLNHSTCCLYNQ